MAGSIYIAGASAAKAKEKHALIKIKKPGVSLAETTPSAERLFLPFYVNLKILEGPGEVRDEGMLLYAKSAEEAGPLSAVCWAKLRRSTAVYSEYPKIKHDEEGETITLDDGDYQDYLKDAKKFGGYLFIGVKDDPIFFIPLNQEIFAKNGNKVKRKLDSYRHLTE
jgi:hypothetical protein